MSRGNSKLYRIREEYIKVLPKISNYYANTALMEGYMFIQEEGKDRVDMITTTCSMKDMKVELVNVDIVMKDGTIKEQRF